MKKINLCVFLFSILWLCATTVFAVEKSVILFGVTSNYRPYSFVDSSGTMHGFCVEFAKLLCDRMQATCQFQSLPFDQLFPALRENKINAAIGAITITPERQKEFNFTLPYMPSNASFIALKNTTYVLGQLVNPEIGVQIGSLYANYLLQNYPDATIKTYQDANQIIAALRQKQIELAMVDAPAANYWVNQLPNDLRLVGSPINLNLSLGIMLNKNDPQLLAQLNAAILVVTKSPAFTDLIKTYFTRYDSTAVQQTELSQ